MVAVAAAGATAKIRRMEMGMVKAKEMGKGTPQKARAPPTAARPAPGTATAASTTPQGRSERPEVSRTPALWRAAMGKGTPRTAPARRQAAQPLARRTNLP